MRCRKCEPLPEEVRRAADLLERRWTVSILYASHEGAVRFNEFLQALGAIPPATLAQRLTEPGTIGLIDAIALRGGGCAVNTSSALVKLGLGAAVVGKVGTDAFGDFLLGLLEERGVEGNGVLRDPSVPTSASVALVDSV